MQKGGLIASLQLCYIRTVCNCVCAYTCTYIRTCMYARGPSYSVTIFTVDLTGWTHTARQSGFWYTYLFVRLCDCVPVTAYCGYVTGGVHVDAGEF